MAENEDDPLPLGAELDDELFVASKTSDNQRNYENSAAHQALEKEFEDYEKYFTDAELEVTLKVLKTFADFPGIKVLASKMPVVKDLLEIGRKALDPDHKDRRERRRKKQQEKTEEDLGALKESGIRTLRKIKMVGMAHGGSVKVIGPPKDGEVEKFLEDRAKVEADEARKALEEREKQIEDEPASGSNNGQEGGEEEMDEGYLQGFPWTDSGLPPKLPPPKPLNFKRSCHTCGSDFRSLHPFYDQLCLVCAELNFSKRYSKADMSGRVCIVTGARVKIGYAIALKLLRMNATVIVTTRFPHDAATRYASEHDAHTFKGRLHIYGLDFRDIRMLHHFTNHIKTHFNRLDVIINNAAQTVRKPPAFYAHLMEAEMQGVGAKVREFVKVIEGVKDSRTGGYGWRVAGEKVVEGLEHLMLPSDTISTSDTGAAAAESVAAKGSLAPPSGIVSDPSNPNPVVPTDVVYNVSASMSQLVLLDTDTSPQQQFPPGLYDRDDQQIDLREVNSWNLELGQISTVEMIETHTINAFAPWVLISELKPLLLRTTTPATPTPTPTPTTTDSVLWDRYIVNVSAMEGQFYRNKTIYHPHSNMAKASLNMLTRTSGQGFSIEGIYMTCVDTGWITDENPVSQWGKREHQPPPLDEFDAAMRVLDPVLVGVRGGEKMWGLFLKNYKPTRW
ncbi:hypothetical protein HDV05_004390 [Chytridiales sp. JEL 0842]|nr:hypothetical protein HDV05_004390 [Chytridiales sp. JEL 0842]